MGHTPPYKTRVRAYRGARFADFYTKPLYRTPDGRYCVKFLGHFYEVTQYDRANFHSERLSPEGVTLVTERPPDWPSPKEMLGDSELSRNDCYLDCSGYYDYFLLNGPKAALDAVRAAFEVRGIVALTYGRSYRTAGDHRRYDWYIRLPETSPPLDSQQLERLLFSDVLSDLVRDSVTGDQVLPRSAATELLGSIARLETEKAEVEEVWAAAEESLDDVKRDSEELRRALDETTREASGLRDQLDSTTSTLAGILDDCFPSIQFLRASESFLFDLPDRKAALTMLRSLNDRPNETRGKRIHGTTFFEDHFSTGQARDGRIYFRRETGHVTVLLSKKGRQKGDVLWLRSV